MTKEEKIKSHSKSGHRVEKTEQNPLGWKIVPKVDPNDVCVLVLGGDETLEDKIANGYAKIIEEDIVIPQGLEDKVKVYSSTYSFTKNFNKEYARATLFKKHNRRTSSALNNSMDKKLANNPAEKEEHINPQYIKEIFENFILPRISDLNGKIKLNSDEAAKRIRKISIVGHCHGAYTAFKLEELMQKKMKDLGYTDKEREKIQKQLYINAHAPACPLGISKSTFVSFCSARDMHVDWHGNSFHLEVMQRIKEDCDRISAEKDNNKDGIENNRKFDFDICFLPEKKGNMFLVKHIYKEEDKNNAININSYREHSFSGYVITKNMTPNGIIMTFFAKNLLTNAIKNSLTQGKKLNPLPPIRELLDKENAKEIFDSTIKNGENFYKDILNDIVAKRKTFAKKITKKRA